VNRPSKGLDGAEAVLTLGDLSDNDLTALPEWLGNLTALTDLNLRRNHQIDPWHGSCGGL
jgi:Leucine-rich repeat (LRR) protein